MGQESITFGGWLKQRRKELGITQEELADSIGCSLTAMRKIEVGERRPSGQLGQLLADYLHISADEREAFIVFARTGRSAPISAEPAPGDAGARAPWRNAYLHQTNLPAVLTPLIGREQEEKAVQDYLINPKVRLLTLTGAPGIGKTRLALEVASNLVEHFEDGVFLVELAAVVDPGLVLPTVAQALGLKETGKSAIESVLLEHVRERKMLLVLDNFEQVLDAANDLVQLMQSSHWLKVLLTSREVLHVRGERRFAVRPLAVPVSGADKADVRAAYASFLPATLAGYAAVDLFVQRAQTVDPDFVLSAENAPAVAAICARLEGLPLAIELAAARADHLSPTEIHAMLSSRQQLSLRGARDVPPRQRTLKSAFEWSYGLLDLPEQKLFRRLSVFVGGCTLAAAAAVFGPAEDAAAVFDLITALVDKSLLQQDQENRDNGATRFWMLETIRTYAAEKLQQSEDVEEAALPSEAAVVERAHAFYFMHLARQAAPHLAGATQVEWSARLEAEDINLQVALRWARDAAAAARLRAQDEGDPELLGAIEAWLRLCGDLWDFWYIRGYLSRGREQLALVLAAASGLPLEHLQQLKAYVLRGAAMLAQEQGDFAEARKIFDASLAISRNIADETAIASLLNNIGTLAYVQGDQPQAQALFEESLAIRRNIDDKPGIATALNNLAAVATEQGDQARAQALHSEGLQMARELGDQSGIAISLNNLANIACAQGDYLAAGELYSASLAIKRELGDRRGIYMSLSNLGYLAYVQEDYARAHASYKESLAGRQELGDRYGMALALIGLGCVAAAIEQPQRGAALLGAAAALLEKIGATAGVESSNLYDRGVASLREQLGDDAFNVAWSRGRELPVAEAIALV